MLHPDPSRVLIRPFRPTNEKRIRNIMARVLALTEAVVEVQVQTVRREFGDRHPGLERFLLEQFDGASHLLEPGQRVSENQRLLIGACFAQEYSLESAALFNPSIIPHPDQAGLPSGSLRFILSLRATGEGHISSITFREGIVNARLHVRLAEPTRFVAEPRSVPDSSYDKALFQRKLREIGIDNSFTRQVLDQLDATFTFHEMNARLLAATQSLVESDVKSRTTARGMRLLAQSNYEVRFSPEQYVAERVLFPISPAEINGMEDARFVRFQNDDGSPVYYATYTAFDGRLILPQLLETMDFLQFKMITLNGPAVQNKGMALFPRKIGGRYAMLGRQDNENISIMFSDHLHFWYSADIVLQPSFPWEFIQMGNCGSPIETEAGWLVMTHGVGPMRKYCIGAFLLDRDDPAKVRGRLRDPLLCPNAMEREGYVPNVVYSCGSLVHNGSVLIPYAMSDHATSFASVSLEEILAAMEHPR